MADLSGFNAKDHEKMGDRTLIKNETVVVGKIVKSEKKNCSEKSKDPSGWYISLQFKVVGGEHKDRVFFTNLNLKNKNAQAVEIAQKELATICDACGVLQPEDSQDLHGIQMKLTIGIEKSKSPKYPDKNYIMMYEKYGGDAIPDSDDKQDAGYAGSKGPAWLDKDKEE